MKILNDDYDLWSLMPLSTIFQLYRGSEKKQDSKDHKIHISLETHL
jgi:hypothetical protein